MRGLLFIFLGAVSLFIPTMLLGESIADKLSINEKLLLSNYPEKIFYPGKICEEYLAGQAIRIIYYHKNCLDQKMAISITLTNCSEESMKVKITKGLGGPSPYEIKSGHGAIQDFLNNVAQNTYDNLILNPKETKSLVIHDMSPQQISAGMIRIEPSQAGRFLLKMQVIDPQYPNLLSGDSYDYVYTSTAHQFISETFDTSSLHKEIPIGDIPFIKDESGLKEIRGNYGLFYHVEMILKNSSPSYKTVNIFISPISGLVQNTVLLDETMIDTGILGIKKHLKPATLIQIKLKPFEERKMKLTLMPEPGSYYPIQVVFQSDYIN